MAAAASCPWFVSEEQISVTFASLHTFRKWPVALFSILSGYLRHALVNKPVAQFSIVANIRESWGTHCSDPFWNVLKWQVMREWNDEQNQTSVTVKMRINDTARGGWEVQRGPMCPRITRIGWQTVDSPPDDPLSIWPGGMDVCGAGHHGSDKATVNEQKWVFNVGKCRPGDDLVVQICHFAMPELSYYTSS